MKTNIVNLTRTPITIINDKISFTVQPSGTVAKVSSKNKKTFSPLCDLIPLVEEMYIEQKNLPKPHKDTIFLVARRTGEHIHGRPDIFYPVQAAVEKMNGKWTSAGNKFTAFKPCL